MSPSGVGVVIVAAGSGSRLGADAPKAFVPLAGVPLLGHALRGALACPGVTDVVVVAPGSHVAAAREVVRAAMAVVAAAAAGPTGATGAPQVGVTVVEGGAERGDSVAAGLAALPPSAEIVLVHDAARCLTPVGVFERVAAAVRDGAPAVVPGLAVVDTIKEVDERGVVIRTPPRSALRAVQTPQGFRRDVLARAHAVSSDATDDAALVERLGESVLVVAGDPLALKVTTPADLETAARILAG
jgi:2-C-methyl-D-erythritol 4-phosphate cytidylyltransferase